MTRKEKLRAAWMATFECYVNEALPDHCGRIDWNAPTHFHNIGMAPDAAAWKYIASVKAET